MKKIGYALSGLLFICLVIKIVLCLGECPEKVSDILGHWAIVWIKGGAVATILILIIFAINKYIANRSNMSLIGMLLLSVLTPGLLYLFFGYDMWLMIIGTVAGIILGFFSYVIDDHLLDVWSIRRYSIPIFVGLGFGGSVIVSTLYENWQDETIYVTSHATGTEVEVLRYTKHTSSGKRRRTYYSWDHHETYYFFNRSESYPKPVANLDYKLGTGALNKTDRAVLRYHKWIGGVKLDKHYHNKGFKWIYLDKLNLKYKPGITYDVEENYFGYAMKHGRDKKFTPTQKPDVSYVALPTGDDVPGPIGMFFSFFKIMFMNPDFALLRWMYALAYIPFIVLTIFVRELRASAALFVFSSTIIIFIILLAVMARSRRSFDDIFEGYGGGSSGGGGAGNTLKW